MNFGTKEVSDVYVGALNVYVAYFGSEKVWEKSEPPTPPTGDWLCLTAQEANSTVAMAANGSAPAVSLEYSTNGVAWSPFVVGTTTVTLANIGDKVYVRATSAGNTGMATNYVDRNTFVMSGKIAASGNVNTLLDQNGNATLTSYCYAYMFSGCSSLTSAPALPATTLTGNCYYAMFKNCSSLTVAPDLPVTQLSDRCYAGMFMGCTSLTTAPELPATKLADACYSYMFSGCSSLTSAPTLPATRLEAYCYQNMFSNCSKLASINVNFDSWVQLNNPTTSWVNGVAASGTFTCPSTLPKTTGVNNIPSGWTIVEK